MWAFGIVMAEYVLRLVPHGTHKLDKCVKPHELEALLEKREYTWWLICYKENWDATCSMFVFQVLLQSY